MRQVGIPVLLAILVLGCANAPDRRAPEGATAPAPEAPPPAIGLAQLEDIFWNCDYLATTQGMDATPVRECAWATRELRQVKFGGSFQRLLAWWREHKPAEHGKRSAVRNQSRL